MASFLFCLRTDGTFYEGITPYTCAQWVGVMYPNAPPLPGVWQEVPNQLLPSDVVVCYFNAHLFLSQLGGEPPRVDTRPLVTQRMFQEDREQYDRLWSMNEVEECPVCFERADVWDSPMNSDIPTRCTHWICVPCWETIATRNKRCPVCREDLSVWLDSAHAASDDE